MSILTKIKEWLSSITATDPDAIVGVEMTYKGKTEKSTLTAKQADDFCEALFKDKKRFFGTKNDGEVKNTDKPTQNTDTNPNSFGDKKVSGYMKVSCKLVDKRNGT